MGWKSSRQLTDDGVFAVKPSRYIQKFYQMRTQLQAISLRIQTVRSNEQMMQSMKGATQLLGSMNRQMNLPALQRIAMEFEKENDIMDQRQEMMDDAIDDVTGLEDEEEGEEVVQQVLDEIGVDLGQAVGGPARYYSPSGRVLTCSSWERRRKACKRTRSRRAGLRKRLAEETPATMTFRHDLIVFADDYDYECIVMGIQSPFACHISLCCGGAAGHMALLCEWRQLKP